MNAPSHFPNEPLYRMQEVLWPLPDRPADLYLRATGGLEQRGGALHCDQGARLDFGTWFNSLYMGFWAGHAGIGALALRLHFRGRLRITVERRREGRPAVLLTRREVDSDGSPYVLPILRPGDSGRLALLLEVLAPTRIEAAAFCTDRPPAPVRLSVGLCTFNREDKLRLTLDALASLRGSLPELGDVLLVNQGDPLRGPETRQAITRAGAREILQPNLGGAGGFARTMAEACASPADPTHHLLMDDDIALDPRMIRRLCEALAHVPPDRALGGAMLETERPRTLHEAGARLLRGWGVASFGTGRTLGRAETLALFDRVEAAHYNGWWFCAVPLAAMRRVGLPLPLFIRGDDIEYGCRLGQAGVASVTLPGCSVWHDAFSGKARPWLTYYDYRNLLVNAALHPDTAPPPRPVEVLGALIARLLCHQYGMAGALRQAVSDYLAGPQALARQDLEARHRWLASRFGQEDGEALAPGSPVPPPRDGPRQPLPEGLGRIVLLFLGRFVQISLVGGRRAGPRHSLSLQQISPAGAGPGPVIRRADPEGRRCLRLAPDRGRLWWGAAAALALWLRYLLGHRRAVRRWRAGAAGLAAPQAWAQRFEAQGAGAPPDREAGT